MGGGLSGFACAVKSAWNDKKVLLVERRPVLGWESTWACQLDFSGKADAVAQSVINMIGNAGGFRQNRADAPILEMALDRLADSAGVEVLLYSYPIRVIFDGDTALGVVIGNKNGEQILKARVIVDATEEALLWRQTEPFRNHPVKNRTASKQIFFFNHSEGEINLPMALDDGLVLYPSVWKNEVLAEFSMERNDVLAARRIIPDIIKRIREKVPQLQNALVSHSASELFPAEPLIHFDNAGIEHPDIRNLFASGIWASQSDNTPVGRLNLGEKAGGIASKCEGAKHFPDEIMTGSVFTPPDAAAADVIVVGGGTGGAIAGVAAGREGAKTMLIEASPVLGGIGTGGAIHSYYHGVSGGIQDEVDERVKKITPLFAGKWKIRGFHPEAKKIVLQQMLEEAGVNLLLNTVVSGVICKDVLSKQDKPVAAIAVREVQKPRKRLTGVISVGPSGCSVYNAQVFIDSTGDGDVAVMAGAPFQAGRERDNLMHAFSQPCGNLTDDGGLSSMNFDAGYVDPADIVDLTRGRRLGINILWRDEFNEQTRLLYIAPIIGLRQSRQIIGEYQLSLADEISGQRFDDVVSYTAAHYDNHGFDYENDSDAAALWVWALGNFGKPFGCEVPYRCLIPKRIDGLLLACRALSVTYDAHMAFRMQKDIQRIGEVAGIAAAMSAKSGLFPGAIDIRKLQSVLKERGFLDRKYLPEPSFLENKPRKLPAAPDLSGETATELVLMSARRSRENALALKNILNSDDRAVRFKAAALAFLGGSDGVNELIKCVTERNPEKIAGQKTVPMWQSAILFLGMAGDKKAIPLILGVLKDENAGLDTLIAALRALARIGDEAVIPAIGEFLKRENLPTERVFQISTKTAFLKPVVDDARWQIELAAAETLIKLGGPPEKIRQIIKPHLEDQRAYVRRYANKLAGTLLQRTGAIR
ncbi:MAG: FAD-dependent oxidoreductase [Kiritimatiellia bacterium]|nr:FAD-dependent oxidoreductase [Kiritimatiellia bacterium]